MHACIVVLGSSRVLGSSCVLGSLIDRILGAHIRPSSGDGMHRPSQRLFIYRLTLPIVFTSITERISTAQVQRWLTQEAKSMAEVVITLPASTVVSWSKQPSA